MMASRIIIAAAKGGQLRRLEAGSAVQYPFAIRALLPRWVGIEGWGGSSSSLEAWRAAAISLRMLLAHCSLWLGTTSNSDEPRSDRLLNQQDVHALQRHLEHQGTPNFVVAYREQRQPIERYLPWLTEDEKLAQQVADAWNEVVRRGEASKVQCPCVSCKSQS